MLTLNPELTLQIARLVHQTFDLPKRWHHGGWGRDDDGNTIQFERRLHVLDHHHAPHPPAFHQASPESPRCVCLATAIHMHTVSALGGDGSNSLQPTDTMCALYTQLAAINTVSFPKTLPIGQPHLAAIAVWNDHNERTYADVRKLTAAVQHHLEA